MQAQELVLRDVHVPAAPALWPPAPGWWVLALALLLLGAAGLWLGRRRRLRRQEWQAMFDAACGSDSMAAQVASISGLLRRAARRVDAGADKLQGDAWLRFLDGAKGRDFSEGAGRLLLDGGYRPEVGGDEFAKMRALAQARFLQLMAARNK